MPLLGLERMGIEERNELVAVFQSPDSELFSVAMICLDASKTEIRSDPVQNLDITLMLHHAKLREDLPSQCRGDPVDSDMEAPFAINET